MYQLDGGILKYFEETQQEATHNHYNGACFVFDKREALGGDLTPQDLGSASRFAVAGSPAQPAHPT